jgi:hypothetical protein
MIEWLKKNVGFAAVRRFKDVFRPVPADKCSEAIIGVGGWNENTESYFHEYAGTLCVAPDNSVWVRVCDNITYLPFAGE